MKERSVMCVMVFLLSVGILGMVGVAQEPALAEQQVLVVGSPDNAITSLDPAVFLNTTAVEIVRNMFSALLRFRPGQASAPDTVEGDLAQSWDVSADGLTWTFHLRKGVQWHSGHGEVTSEDVKFSIERVVSIASSYAGDFSGIAETDAPDRYTVVITLADPDVFFPMKVANHRSSFVVSKSAVEEMGDEAFGANPVGSGPFAFSRWTPNDRVVLVRNEEYFRGIPILERIDFLFMGDVNTRVLALKSGDIHCSNSGLDNEDTVKDLRNSGIIVDVKGFESPITLHYNMTVSPFDDIKVRKALAYAINREDFVDFHGQSLCQIQYSMVPPTIFGGVVDGLEPYEYDPQLAQTLLEQAGYPNGFSIGEVFMTERDLYRIPLEIVQANWAKIGVDLEIKVVAHSEFHSLIRENLNSVVIYAGARATPDMYLTEFLHSASIVGKETAKTNFSHYGDVDADGDGLADNIDAIIEQARRETDPEKAKVLYAMAQMKVAEDLPVFPLRLTASIQARSPLLDLGHEVYRSTTMWGYLFTEETRILQKK